MLVHRAMLIRTEYGFVPHVALRLLNDCLQNAFISYGKSLGSYRSMKGSQYMISQPVIGKEYCVFAMNVNDMCIYR